MASCTTAYWDDGNSTPRVRLTVTQKSSDADSVVLSWVFEYLAHSAISTSITHDCTATINDTKVVNMIHATTYPFKGGYEVDGKTGTHTIASGEIEVAKGKSAKTVSFSCSMDFTGIKWSGTFRGSNMTASGTISVGAKTSYTVSYNANGGSGAPSSQTKWYGETLTLSSTIPTRAGHSFVAWALTKADADAGTWYYKAGSSCGKNENLTLYAVWQANTYTVSYNANGGSGAPSSQTKTYGVTLKLSSTIPTRTNYTFKGWGTSASATTVSYAAGANYTNNAGITLYAVWELSYVKPRIANFYINRCLQNGTATDDGTYARVRFDWSCDRNISSITIRWIDSAGNPGSTTVGASGTSGSVNTIVGGSLDVEKLYTIEITVRDTVDASYATATLNGKKFIMDFLAGGNGIAFGKAAELSGYAEFGFAAMFNGSVRGNAFGLGTLDQLSTNDDLNTLLTPGVYGVGSHAIGGSLKNSPAGSNAGRVIVCSATGGGYGVGDWTYLQQWYIPMVFNSTQPAIYVRTITREPNKAPNYYAWFKFTGTVV